MNRQPPVKYLSELTKAQLGQFELWKLNQVSNLQKEIRVAATEILEAIFETRLAQECIEHKAEALLARWLVEHRGELGIGVAPDELPDFEGGAVVDPSTVLSFEQGRTRDTENVG